MKRFDIESDFKELLSESESESESEIDNEKIKTSNPKPNTELKIFNQNI